MRFHDQPIKGQYKRTCVNHPFRKQNFALTQRSWSDDVKANKSRQSWSMEDSCTLRHHCPGVTLQDDPCSQVQNRHQSRPLHLPQMKYATINPPAYISNMLASRCPLCSDWAPVATWVTVLCLKPPCEDLWPWHTTLKGGVFWTGQERGQAGKFIHFAFEWRQRHLDEGQWQDCGKVWNWVNIWACSKMRSSLFDKDDTYHKKIDRKMKTK